MGIARQSSAPRHWQAERGVSEAAKTAGNGQGIGTAGRGLGAAGGLVSDSTVTEEPKTRFAVLSRSAAAGSRISCTATGIGPVSA